MEGFVSDLAANQVLRTLLDLFGTWHMDHDDRCDGTCLVRQVETALRDQFTLVPTYRRAIAPQDRLESPLDVYQSGLSYLRAVHSVYDELSTLAGTGKVCPGCRLCAAITTLTLLGPTGRCVSCQIPLFGPPAYLCGPCSARGVTVTGCAPRAQTLIQCPHCRVALPHPWPAHCPGCTIPLIGGEAQDG